MEDTAPDAGIGTAGTLSAWIADLRFDAIPAHIRHQAKACLLDSIGCAIGGINTQPSQIILEVLSANGGSAGPVTLPGTCSRLALLEASYLGPQAVNALDFDDSTRAGVPGHPGATVIPPALAVAEVRGASGAELITAVVAGYEASMRIGRSVQASPDRKRAVMGFSAWQTFGAVSAAASLMKLSPERIRNAFGLAGVQAPVPGIRKFFEGGPPFSWAKNSYGIAGQVGVLSALLAERGFLGNREVFDGEHGFWVMSGSDRYDQELAVERLGELWLIADVGFKPYACCRWTHTMLDSLRSLSNELVGRRVERVDVRGFRELTQTLNSPFPQTIIDAQFNARYVAALELTGRTPERGLVQADLAAPDVLAMAERVRLIYDAKMDEPYFKRGMLPVHVVVSCVDGTSLSAEADWPAGSVEAGGFSDEALDRKFMAITGPVLGEAAALRALGAIRSLEKGTARDLAAFLVPVID